MDDSHSLGFLFGLLFLFLVGSAFFSASETGIMTSNRYRLKHQAKLGNKTALRILKLLQQPDRLIGVILIGNNTVNNLAAVVATLIGIKIFGNVGASIAAGVLTFVMLVFCEVGPKTYAASHPERISGFASHILAFLLKAIYPLVWLLNKITNLLFQLNTQNSDKKDKLTREELHSILHDVFLPTKHRNMLLGILELDNITVNDIMIPRQEVKTHKSVGALQRKTR